MSTLETGLIIINCALVVALAWLMMKAAYHWGYVKRMLEERLDAASRSDAEHK